jgi:threonylcarbamoyladenosine tRNA methylthiotransferase MtaB
VERDTNLGEVKQKVAFHTLGCKLNFAETSMISSKFRENNFQVVGFNTDADVYIINTCTVTQVADKKCRQIIKKATGKGAKVVVIGCYSQLKPNEIEKIEGVDLILGTKEKFNILEHVTKLLNNNSEKIFSSRIEDITDYNPSYSVSDRTRAFLKVQDGCDYHCSYCTVPLARGISRNDSISSVVQLAEKIASEGIKEIVLTGVNIGDFGKSTGENFFELIKNLDKVEGISRFRISSIEPNLLSDDIIRFVASSEKFAPHFHIPLQSGCDSILAAMGRRYKREIFSERVHKIKDLMPFACIGADVIVGFPGETEDEFNNQFQFVNDLDINYLHVFPFSERPGTKAALMSNKVRSIDKTNRSKILNEASDKMREKFYKKNFGRKETVIFESRNFNGFIHGFTSNYIKVEAPYNKLQIGTLTNVVLNKMNSSNNFVVEF